MKGQRYTDLYRDLFNSLRETPPPEVGQQVFERMERERSRKRRKWILTRGSMAFLVLGVLASWMFLPESEDTPGREMTEVRGTGEVSSLVPGNQEAGPDGKMTASWDMEQWGDKKSEARQEQKNGRTREEYQMTVNQEETRENVQPTDPHLNKMPVMKTRQLAAGSPKGDIGDRAFDGLEEHVVGKESKRYASLSFGPLVKIKQTRLLDNRAYESFDPGASIHTRAGVTTDIGGFVRYRLNRRQSIRAELTVLDRTEQTYWKESEGNPLKEKTRLGYTRLSVLYQRRSPITLGSTRHGIDLVAGVYYGFLRNATQEIGEASRSLMDEYSRHDVGVELGLQYSHAITPQLDLFGGVRATSGMMNIYKGTDELPGTFNRTRNLTWGVGVGLEYRLRR